MPDTKAPEVAQPSEESSRRSRHSQTALVLSAALVVVLAVLAVWLIVDDPDPVVSPPPNSPSAAGPASSGPATGCGPAAGDQTPPASPPSNGWHLVGTMAAPVSTSAGPLKDLDSAPRCYAPDPQGALFAAANFLAGFSSGEHRLQVVDQLAADGPGRDAALEQLQADAGPDTRGVQIAGFSPFLAYQPGESATIDFALRTGADVVHLSVAVLWQNGDWHILLPVTGHPFDQVGPLPSMAGYIPWAGA